MSISINEDNLKTCLITLVRHDIESACKRLSLAGALIQSFLADSLDAHGLSSTPGRKTVQVKLNFASNPFTSSS